jgi:hypothetical protein
VKGSVNYITGEVAPTAGGYVDTKTGLYIPPPAGSAYDQQTETFIPPPNYGGFDTETGEYTNANFTLTPEGKFVALPTDPTNSRLPASETELINNTQNSPPPPEDLEIIFAACMTEDCSLPPPPLGETAGPLPGPTPPPIQELSCEQLGTCPPAPIGVGRNVEFIFN